MIRHVLVFALAAVLVTGLTGADDKKDAPAKLEGTYTIISGEEGGKPIPEERIKGSLVTFKGDRVLGTDKDKKEFFAASYQLDTSSKPWKITMTSTTPKTDEAASGVVEIDGDTVRVCYALPGGQAPTGFKTKEKQQCFTLKRQTK